MFVVDASAFVKLVLDEPGSEDFRAWYSEHKFERALQKAGPRMRPRELQAVHARLVGLVDLAPPSLDAWEFAEKLTFYDAEYVQFAAESEATLVTADPAMAAAARRLKLSVLEIPSRASH